LPDKRAFTHPKRLDLPMEGVNEPVFKRAVLNPHDKPYKSLDPPMEGWYFAVVCFLGPPNSPQF